MSAEFGPKSVESQLNWDIHDFNDNCPWQKDSPIHLLRQKINGIIQSHNPLAHFAEMSLNVEASLGLLKYRLEEAPSQTKLIPKGEKFDPKEWPRGTIVRYSYDFQNPNQLLSDIVFVGVVAQRIVGSRHTDLVSAVSDRSGFSHAIEAPIEVGKIVHKRIKHYPGFGKQSQSLSRFNWFEIYRYGQDYRE